MNLFHILFTIALGFIASSIYEIYRRVKVHSEKIKSDSQVASAFVIAFSALIGVFLLFAAIPGAFLNQPHWFVDKLFRVVEVIIEVFT